jgi:hypothetical protein
VRPAIEDAAAFLGGFVAAEGSFNASGDPPRFSFTVGLSASDSGSCVAFRDFLGVGRVHWSPRRKPHYDDEVTFAVQSLRELVETVVPFMDEHLPVSYKREQFVAWRERLLDYWEHRAKRVRKCTIVGCERPRRAHGLCRRHLYLLRGV